MGRRRYRRNNWRYVCYNPQPRPLMKFRHKYVSTLSVVCKYGHNHNDTLAFFVSTDQFLDSEPVQLDYWKKNYLYFIINKVDMYFKNFRINEAIYEVEPEDEFNKRKIKLTRDVYNKATNSWTTESYTPTQNKYLAAFKDKSLTLADGIELKTRNIDYDSKRQYIMTFKQDNSLGNFTYNLAPEKLDGIKQYSLSRYSKHKFTFLPRCKKRVELTKYNNTNKMSTLLDYMDASNKYGIVSFGPLTSGEEPLKESTGIILERTFQVTLYSYVYMTFSGQKANLDF